ncbi:MAG: Svx/AvrXca family virulence/avirulence protein [Balneolaceae bacterium]
MFSPSFLLAITASPVVAQVCEAGTFEVKDPGEAFGMLASDHFVVRWEEEIDDDVYLSESQMQDGLDLLEDIWVHYVNEIGFQEPYCDTAEKYKVDINIILDGYAFGSGTGLRHPEMWVNQDAFQNGGALAHEFTHTLQFTAMGLRDSPYVGWFWESHAEWMRHQYFRNDVLCSELMVNYPHLYYGSTRNRYCNWLFWEYLKNEFGHDAVNDIWINAPEPGDAGQNQADPFTVLADNMGWSVSELNDQFGQWAMRNATWDYTNPDGSNQGNVYRQNYGTWNNTGGNRYQRVTRLEEIDPEEGTYAVNEHWAPQRWGYNLVRLRPDQDQDATITVRFEGIVQDLPENTSFTPYLPSQLPSPMPNPDSDWRWGLVAMDAAYGVRYSDLQRGHDAVLDFDIFGDDRELWLVVVGTPSTIHKVLWDQFYFTLYRYPWMVHLEGARPDGFEEGASGPTSLGAPHPNGGGWVSNFASVSSDAYVGPYARVLEGTVSGNARIEDHAVIRGGTVRDNAVVGGLTMVNSGATIRDNAKVGMTFSPIGNNQTVQSSGQLYGDVELGGAVSVSNGVYYGFVNSSTLAEAAHGSGQSEPPQEVTTRPPYAIEAEQEEEETGNGGGGQEEEEFIPDEYALLQNFPNPSSSSTTIRYHLPHNQRVTLRIYDALGREAAVLLDDQVQSAGEHEIEFNPAGMKSGIYFYRIETGSFTETRSLTIIR